EYARELPGLDPQHLARRTMVLLGDLGHGALLARQQHGLGLVLVLLVGVRIAAGEDGAEEQQHTEERDAHAPGVTEPGHGLTRRVGCRCPERDSAVPFRTDRSTGSRGTLLPPAPP